MRVVGSRTHGCGDREGLSALAQLPDGAAKELEGDDTLHEEPYRIRINASSRSTLMSSASGLTWSDLEPYRTRIDGVPVVSLEGLLRTKQGGRSKDRARPLMQTRGRAGAAVP